MRFELFVAARYLRAKRRQAVIGVITVISVIGVTAGVASLVIALSINAGFQKDLQDQLLGSQSHINLVRAQAGVTNVAFLADLYHLGKMGEDLPATLAREAASIAHIQVADVPDRGAPGTGELDFEALFGQLAAQGYAGWIGCEYKPSDPADSSTSFGWREPHGV